MTANKIIFRPLSWFDDCAERYLSPRTPADFFFSDQLTTMSLDAWEWRYRSDWNSRYQSFCGRLAAAQAKFAR